MFFIILCFLCTTFDKLGNFFLVKILVNKDSCNAENTYLKKEKSKKLDVIITVISLKKIAKIKIELVDNLGRAAILKNPQGGRIHF